MEQLQVRIDFIDKKTAVVRLLELPDIFIDDENNLFESDLAVLVDKKTVRKSWMDVSLEASAIKEGDRMVRLYKERHADFFGFFIF